MNVYKIKYISLTVLVALMFVRCSDGSDGLGSTNSGQGGSLARFAVDGDALYVVDRQSLHKFDITDPFSPTKGPTTELGFGVETIFPYKGNLFIGTQTGMHIVVPSLNGGPPILRSTYEHILGCDPVVVQGNYAYVTIRGGNACFRFENRLDVVDISDLSRPRNVGIYDMISPYGLGVDQDLLFVSEGTNGFKALDITNPLNVKEIELFTETPAIDMIPKGNNTLIIVGQEGISQFDYASFPDRKMKLLSTIQIEK